MNRFLDFADEVRRIARKEARNASPPIKHYRVIRRQPFTLEAFDSESILVDGEESFDVSRSLRVASRVGDTILVATDEHGDKIALTKKTLKGDIETDDGTAPYYVPRGEKVRISKNRQAMFSDPIDVEGTLEIEGRLIEVE